MSASAGRVLILLKGEYNSATSYQMLDAVHYHGSLYIAKKATLGNVPQDGEYWMLCASGATWGDIGGIITNQTDLMNLLNGKQNTLTFDTVPTASSTNPVTSAGIKTAVDAKITNPAGGSTGDVLRKTATGEAWTPETGSAWGSITGNIDSQTDLKTKLDASASNIATIESTAFASKAYVEGEFLTYNGQLYEVIAAIALGEALVIGTNIEATSVGEELTALNNGLTNLNSNYIYERFEVAVTASVDTTIGTVTLPTVGVWLVIAVGDLNASVNNNYNLVVNGRVTRGNGTNGGGVCNTLLINVTSANTPVTIKGYVPGTSCTFRCTFQAIKLR